jgi:hypothetical protein
MARTYASPRLFPPSAPPLVLVLLLAVGCGGAPSRTAARDRVVGAICNTYQRCDAIGSGLMFPDRPACEENQTMYWDSILNPEACEDKINASRLDACTATISGFDCDMLVDLLDVVGVCGAAAVCPGT